MSFSPRAFFSKGDSRTILLKKNIILSILFKGISILASLAIIPATIDYVNPTRYGIWLTLSSFLSWLFFFDFGFGLGLRNKFTEAKALNDTRMAREYVSTTYFSLFVMSLLLLVVVLPINYLIDWSDILKVSQDYRQELYRTFSIMIIFFAANLVFQTISIILTADQRPAFASMLNVIGQLLVLSLIYIAKTVTGQGSLPLLAVIASAAPVAVMFIASLFYFLGRYREYAPSLKNVRLRLIKDILGLGSKFFIITTSMLFIFQLMNLIISRELGPETVTEYNISFKYFNTIFMVATLILNPLWSAVTDAYTQGNNDWIKMKLRQMERLALLLAPLILVMLVVAPPLFNLWIGDSVTVHLTTNISVAVYTVLLTLSNLYMYIINGIGKVRIQLYIYLFFAIIAFPAMSWMCRIFGIPGLLIIPTIVYFLQALLGRIQINKILSNNATGIWDKN